MLLSSFAGFWRVKRWESSIRSSSEAPQVTAESDRAIRHNLAHVFGVGNSQGNVIADERGHVIVIPAEAALAEARLANDLRNAGLI